MATYWQDFFQLIQAQTAKSGLKILETVLCYPFGGHFSAQISWLRIPYM